MKISASFWLLSFCVLATVALLASCASGSSSGVVPTAGLSIALQADAPVYGVKFDSLPYQMAVLATKPLAYFPLNKAGLGSVPKKYTVKFHGGAKIATGGPIKSQPANNHLYLLGKAFASTSLHGGIPGTGSMVAWVDLTGLPSKAGHQYYVSGESQNGNDFDVEFNADNNLYFYTGSGEYTEYTTNPSKLDGRWHMIAVTYRGGSSGFRNIYWNGSLVSPFKGSVDSASKTSQFNIGESLVFPGRYFQGGITAVAVWKRALTAKEIRTIYLAAQ